MSENHVMSSMSAPHLAEQIREDHIPWLDRFSPFFGVKLPGARLTPQRRMDVQEGFEVLKFHVQSLRGRVNFHIQLPWPKF